MNTNAHNTKHHKEIRINLYLHQSYSLPGLYTFLVNEYQNANDGTNKAEASHEAGYNERRVHRHRHQLVAALAVVVPVLTYRAPGREEETYSI